MTATEAALSGLIDYAGLYPPAALDMREAVGNYLAYSGQKHAWMLGRFIVDATRMEELRDAAGDALDKMRLSVIATPDIDRDFIARHVEQGFRIESVEMKCGEASGIMRVRENLPAGIETYFEIPLRAFPAEALDALAATGGCAKLRTGGVVAEAFPTAESIVQLLVELHAQGVAFKATAGLHHPLRSRHRLTYAADAPTGIMHGFVNLLCASALIHFGGNAMDAAAVLEEEHPEAFRVAPDSLGCRGCAWSAEQLWEVRQFFTGFGSCSFTEPISDLEALGWF